jgi:LPXTG-motif cell wall-anchored protein
MFVLVSLTAVNEPGVPVVMKSVEVVALPGGWSTEFDIPADAPLGRVYDVDADCMLSESQRYIPYRTEQFQVGEPEPTTTTSTTTTSSSVPPSTFTPEPLTAATTSTSEPVSSSPAAAAELPFTGSSNDNVLLALAGVSFATGAALLLSRRRDPRE